ncbi:Glycine betaine/carnitine/choline transport ATP-binding protein OpuCA [Rhodococcus ruber]|uniref:ABC transporter ATP-binding protein n=1 Tax=Rhodococcus ruber TaxID=1830 RepID=UPI00315DAEC4
MNTPPPSAAQISGTDIDLIDVVKTFPGQARPAVDGLSLHIPAGEIVMFVGPSGCGKTTSLKMINRLVEPTSGTIRIGGDDIRSADVDDLRRRIGYVIQGGSLFPHMTVAQNISIVPRLLGWDRRRTADRVTELLELVNLAPDRYRDRYPRELSGGQQQRVGVARGLAADPPVVLMDEPFGAVDPITRLRLQDELLRIHDDLRKTIVCVTHDIDEAVKLGSRILIMQEGGHVAQYDTPETILSAPASPFVEKFVGAGSTLKQLSLSRVAEVELAELTTAEVGSSAEEAVARARARGDDTVVVLDRRRRPVAWLWVRELQGSGTVPDGDPDDLVTLDRHATLNDALDTMLASAHGAAIVTGRHGEFQGLINFESVTGRIRGDESQSAAAGPGETGHHT